MTTIRQVVSRLKHHISAFEKDLVSVRSNISDLVRQNDALYQNNREIVNAITEDFSKTVSVNDWYRSVELEFGSNVASAVGSLHGEVQKNVEKLEKAIEERKTFPEQLALVKDKRSHVDIWIGFQEKELKLVLSLPIFDYAKEIVDSMSIDEYEEAKKGGVLATILSSKVRLVKKYLRECDNPSYENRSILFFSKTKNPFEAIDHYRAYVTEISDGKEESADLAKEQKAIEKEIINDKICKEQLDQLKDLGQGAELISNLVKKCFYNNTDLLDAYAERNGQGACITYMENVAKIKVNRKIKQGLKEDANSLNSVIGNLEKALKKIPYSKRNSSRTVRRFDMADFESKMLNTSSALSYKNNWYSSRRGDLYRNIDYSDSLTTGMIYWMFITNFFLLEDGLDHTGAALIFNDDLSEIQNQVSVDGVNVGDNLDVTESLDGIAEMSGIQDMMVEDLDMSGIQESMDEVTRTMDSLSSDMSSLASDLGSSDFGSDSFSGGSDF